MAAQSRLKSSQTDLDKTELKIPFDAIIVEKNASLGEIAGINTKLGLLYSIDRARLEIPVSGEDFHWLLRDKNTPERPDESAAESAYNLFDTARVITENNGFSVEWPARVVSTGGRVNTSTRTINLILEIDDPFNIYHKAQNPPLAAGMFCRADFTGRTLKNVFIIPRKAYYQNGTVKIFKDNRAWIKKVEIIASQEDTIIISDDSWDDETMVITTKSELILNDMKVLPANAKSAESVTPNTEAVTPNTEASAAVLKTQAGAQGD
jgi:multidrug efflux pump subunit AcrA (membrane-fusion protein)